LAQQLWSHSQARFRAISGAPYTKAPAYTAPQVVYNWTGFYIAATSGGAFCRRQQPLATTPVPCGVQAASTISSPALGGWRRGAVLMAGNNNNGVLFPAAPWSARTTTSWLVTGRSATPGARRCSTPRGYAGVTTPT